MSSIKEIYGLSYDVSGFNSGLVKWYNRMIDKLPDELDAADVSRMMRQNILKEVAVGKAINLFMADPYDGELSDGDLLNTIVTYIHEVRGLGRLDGLGNLLFRLELEYLDFDWPSEDLKVLYFQNIKKFMNIMKSKE